MACHNRPGPAAYRHYIEQVTGQRITQQEWHDLRELAALEGRSTARSRVTPEEALYAASYLGGNLRLEFGNDPDTLEGRQQAFDDMAEKLNATNVTAGTVSIVRYLADYGVKDSLTLARQYRKNGGTLTPVAGNEPDGGWDEERAAVAAEVAVERDDNWAEADLADSDRRWSERVAYFESLGMTTSDAQGAADAEDLIREKAKQGPYGQARVGAKFTGYRDASAISKDVRGDIKDAVKAGDLPSDIKTSVKTDKYAGGQAVNVRLTGWEPERVWRRENDQYGPRWVYTPEAKAVMARVEDIRGAYNRDASESQMDYYDVTYYGNTQWDVPTPQ